MNMIHVAVAGSTVPRTICQMYRTADDTISSATIPMQMFLNSSIAYPEASGRIVHRRFRGNGRACPKSIRLSARLAVSRGKYYDRGVHEIRVQTMKIKRVLLLAPLMVAILAGCSGGNGNDVTEDVAVYDVQSGDTVVLQDTATADAAGHDLAVADLPGTDVAPSDVLVEDFHFPDLPSDTPTVDASEDVPADAVEPVNIGLNPRLSECGGFAAIPRAGNDPACADELLDWEVDAEDGVIHFTNTGVFLNCCGAHGITVALVQGVYVITETDDPHPVDGRCKCMCMFDFAVDMPIVEATTIGVRIERLVAEDGETLATIWEGDIDLTAGSGEIVVEEDVGWCDNVVNLAESPQFSACGGFGADRLINLDVRTETLDWTFEPETTVVSFANRDICLNCCGEHSMAIFLVDGVYVLTEVDEPAGEGGRCFCDCSFDYAVDLTVGFSGTIDVMITREITDFGMGVETVWEGSIDLSAGSGSIVVHEYDTSCI